MTKLHVIIRTCDKKSLVTDRISSKEECIPRCLKSLVNSLQAFNEMPSQLIIIDDNSSDKTKEAIKKIAPDASHIWLEERDESDLNPRQKSRYSVKIMYDYIHTLPEEDLVYIVEDDYLHYPNSIAVMINSWKYFSEFTGKKIGIFPQDFPQLYPHPMNPHNDIYVKPCIVIPGLDRYFRTTWYTHESFMIPVSVIHEHKESFDSLLTIGNDPALWEGNTISSVWTNPDVMMLMPIGPLAIHVSSKDDFPFFNKDFMTLWMQNKVS